tara:strand:- start:2617 stop:4386 length:1770 start_codon:yes stop_codon:yes gene_type:complete
MRDVRIVNLATYSTPKITERKNKDWVEYGDDNNYYQYLIDRFNGSATNNAIVNGISEMIYGKGLAATDASRRPDEYAQMVSLFTKDCMRKVVFDLKLMGQATVQIIYSKDRKKIAQVEHFPVETLRLEKCNEDGDIEGYYYHKDWTKIKPHEQPKRIPAFGTSNESIEIMCIKPYKTGYYYYSPVDYQGGLQYAELEEEVANYHLNNIKNGLAPSMLINFNNGIPNEEERSLIERRIQEKFSGTSNAGKFILAFNDSVDAQANIEPVQLSDAHNQYEFLSTESSKKILVSHRIVSPMLFGIKDQTGLGNNADEIKTASILTDNVVVKPFQNLIIDALDQILAYNGISLNLYFKTLQPLEFIDHDNVDIDDETKEEETGVERKRFNADTQSAPNIESIAEDLITLGEEEESLEGWELVDEMDVDYNMEEKLDKMIGLASTGTSRPNAKSEQDQYIDGVQFKVRYQYGPKSVSSNSREFCKKMVSANKLYRKEDIIRMDNLSVNAGWGKGGADTYSIWKFKGGGGCHHKWVRKTFRFTDLPKGQGDTKSPNAPTISTNKAEREGARVRNPKEVSMKPKDMPNEGFIKPRKK